MSRYRAFTFTDFELDYEFWDTVCEKSPVKYLIAGDEVCPKTGKPHWQGYVYFTNARPKSEVIKQLRPRHVEVAKGTPQQNYTYCTKDSSIVLEIGDLPRQGVRVDLEEIASQCKLGASMEEIADSNPAAYIRYHKGIEKYRDLKNQVKPRDFKSKVTVYWGPTGTGKTERAVKDHGGVIVEWDNHYNFVLNYEHQKCVIFDDFDLACAQAMGRAKFLKLTDKYAYTVNMKNVQKGVQWNPVEIVFTSNIDPRKWFGDDPAIIRRFDKIVETQTFCAQKCGEGNTETSPQTTSERDDNVALEELDNEYWNSILGD